MTPSVLEFTEDQEKAIESVSEFLDNNDEGVFRVGGLAGTGKSTILSEILDDYDSGIPCAFTGKAADVLRRKGILGASTIHSVIYSYNEITKKFYLKCPRQVRALGDFFAIDEGSMVSKELWKDLQTFDMPIIVFGDHGQLEPVGDDVGLMKDCDIVLEKIHRQAEKNPIVQLAHKVRDGGEVGHSHDSELAIVNRNAFWDTIGEVDHLICGFNQTRQRANKRARELRGYEKVIEEGERLIVLQNDPVLGVFNGQILTVTRVLSKDTVRVMDYDESEWILRVTTDFIGGRKIEYKDIKRLRHKKAFVDYAYCTTCHKSQGSEFDSVAVMDEQCSYWSPERWRYTAITRAAKQLVYAI